MTKTRGKSSVSLSKLILIILVCSGLAIFGAYYFINQYNLPKTPPDIYSNNQPPSPQPGFKEYNDETLKYGFSYPDSQTVNKCSDVPCAFIDAISLRIQPLSNYYLPETDHKESLLNNDLYCSAAGPMGSIDCKTTKVEDFTNSLGFKGYKIFRTKTRSGQTEKIYEDIAYVFPLKNIVKIGQAYYAGVLFAVDETTEGNLSSLDKIADSFYNF